MNNSRRKRINQCIKSLEDARYKLEEALREEKLSLESTPDDEEFEDMRDGMDEIISGLDETISYLEDTLSTLNSSVF